MDLPDTMKKAKEEEKHSHSVAMDADCEATGKLIAQRTLRKEKASRKVISPGTSRGSLIGARKVNLNGTSSSNHTGSKGKRDLVKDRCSLARARSGIKAHPGKDSKDTVKVEEIIVWEISMRQKVVMIKVPNKTLIDIVYIHMN